MTPTMEEVAGWLREAAFHVVDLADECLMDEAAVVQANFNARAAQVEAMGWRPIEEAPKDGTHVDLWDDARQDRETDCRWTKNAWYAWIPNAFVTMDWCRVDGKLTHFIPRPQPPVKK